MGGALNKMRKQNPATSSPHPHGGREEKQSSAKQHNAEQLPQRQPKEHRRGHSLGGKRDPELNADKDQQQHQKHSKQEKVQEKESSTLSFGDSKQPGREKEQQQQQQQPSSQAPQKQHVKESTPAADNVQQKSSQQQNQNQGGGSQGRTPLKQDQQNNQKQQRGGGTPDKGGSNNNYKKNVKYAEVVVQELFTGGVKNNPTEEPVWRYVDNEKQIQGPWTSKQMLSWYKQGYFDMDLLVVGLRQEALSAKPSKER